MVSMSNTLQKSLFSGDGAPPNSLLTQVWTRLFESRCEDLGLKSNEK